MPKANAAFMKPHTVSADLAAVIGSGQHSRPEVTKKIWEYIKKHNLQDTKDKRLINTDEALKKVFNGQAQVHMMKMAGFISKHLS